MALQTYVPQDRLRALARGEELADRSTGAALFADITGFTALTESLRLALGERRGIEALTQRVNAVYEALIGEVERHGGSVIGFSGDAVICWFDRRDGEASRRAARCALAMQQSMRPFPDLSVKVAVGSGDARRFAVGDPQVQRIDVIAGATVARAAAGEGLARAGEVLVDTATAAALPDAPRESRTTTGGECFQVLDAASAGALGAMDDEPAAAPPSPLAPELLRPWVQPNVFEMESAGAQHFVPGLRPTTALFLRFDGIDYDRDEHAGAALDALVAQTQRELQGHGGVLLELVIGDKGSYLYGSFGAAQVHEDDACRAVRAAVALRSHFEAQGRPVQIGLSSGTMRVGGYGSSTRTSFGAIGDDVNAAARLMGLAQPGEILISGRVRRQVAGEFTLAARAPMPVKGKAEPMPVFAVLAASRRRAIRLQEPGYALPMIGREAESARLADKLALALQGHGQVVGITAEAGMGKSRLVAEGIHLARRSRLAGYGGACRLDGIRTPYLVWQPIWLAFFDLDADLPLRRQVRALEAELEERAPEHVEAWPLLGAAMGLDLPDNDFTRALQPKDRKALLEAVLLQCLASAAREAAGDGAGLLLVLEDLHAADPLSLDLLQQVLRAIEHLPVLVLLTYRPGDASSPQPAHARFESLRHFEAIELGALAPAQAEQVLRSKLAALFPERVGAVPAALVERIVDRAQGNPFYVEELLSYLHDCGVDPSQPASLDALELPASLHSLVLSRIDQLRPSQQLSLKAASIIGRVFRVLDLHRYEPALGTLDALKADLRELERLGFTPLESPEPELSYLFKHLVTLEVGYQSIDHASRVELHRRYARYLESADAEGLGRLAAQLAHQLAHHYLRADVPDKACIYLRKAGEQAAAGYANDEALACYGQALERLPPDDVAARADVLLRREAILDLQGRHDERRRELAELEALAARLDDPALGRAQVAIRRAKLELDIGEPAAARPQAWQAIDALEPRAHAPGPAALALVDALLLDARALFHAGQATAARPQLERALALAREHGHLRGECIALSQLGLLHWHAGDYASAQHGLAQSLQRAQEAGDPRPQLDVLNNLGVVAKTQAKYAEAVGHYEQAQRIARRIGDRSGEAMLFNNMGSACLASGDFVQAGAHCEQAARIFAEVQEPTQHGMALINRAEAHRELGRYGPAQSVANQALALLRASGFRRGEAIVLENLGLIALALGQLDEARAATEAARAIATDIGLRALEASTLHHLGQIDTAAGRLNDAQRSLDAASTLMRELDAGPPALEVQTALAELALARGGADAPARALAHLAAVLPVLLDTASNVATSLPLAVYRIALRVLAACGDARAAPLRERARRELQARSERIADAAVRRDYLAVAEHRAIAEGEGGLAP